MLNAAAEGGLSLFQISMVNPQAIKLIESTAKRDGIIVGAGNVTDGEMAQRAINAGAKFVASPYTDSELIRVAKNNDCFVIQGAFTATEVAEAFKLGADLVTLWPVAFAGGVDYVKLLRNNLPFVRLIAQGGVTFENAFEYLKHCTAVSLRSALFERGLIRSDNWAEITARAKQFAQRLDGLKVSKS
ncbi:MAG: hypothetical protein A2Z83_07180 [Omnitrophica bacterium GWA2_52_8]|nr:MAG: hypothetical protein A2Z83_07180 [Omnitrophica bacterium GWA2_52_8]